MRAVVTLEAVGKNLNEALELLLKKWQTVIDDEVATLPPDAEIYVSQVEDTTMDMSKVNAPRMFKISYTARIKI